MPGKTKRIVVQYQYKGGGVMIYDYLGDGSTEAEYLNTFDQILSTFKFTK